MSWLHLDWLPRMDFWWPLWKGFFLFVLEITTFSVLHGVGFASKVIWNFWACLKVTAEYPILCLVMVRQWEGAEVSLGGLWFGAAQVEVGGWSSWLQGAGATYSKVWLWCHCAARKSGNCTSSKIAERSVFTSQCVFTSIKKRGKIKELIP